MAKILIVDDAKFMRVTLANILEKDNHEIVGEAENGVDAVDMYKQVQPDLVTMDITMPVMNGIDAIKEIIQFNPNAQILVCSAMGQQKVVVEAIENGAKDFIIKPFEEGKVRETIKTILHNANEISTKM
ncbi:two-component system, chemotaxis family, response regulator CheY [Oceanobacillus limi]|uniref:Two-component system, chemotaxis family, response regulator CheY n=1 Tax=Oceanobacillus limi TaxID=930131 RepID=A0A1H9ZAE0_9BACI|nr:response regulator [Oceanobacillus limi]SES77817.1 two-component system, chemotaxis family, response regulator CheY [Oceanobacillus limi]